MNPTDSNFYVIFESMKTLAVTVKNKKQEQLFIHLANELGIDISEARFKPLTTKEAALGVGKKFTDEQLSEYLIRNKSDKTKGVTAVKRSLKNRLQKTR